MNADTLKAGRELDALIAERVMGYVWRRFDYPPAGGGYKYGKPWKWLSTATNGADVEGGEERYIDNVRAYSTDIAAAWLVVEQMRKGVGAKQFQLDSIGFGNSDEGEWRCMFSRDVDGQLRLHIADADTAPLAICLAAVAALDTERTT